MRIKKVTRYYCDFCSRGYFRIDAIKHHEERCTANPDRKCGMCDRHLDYREWSTGFDKRHHGDGMATLRWLDAMVSCPACILTILRLSGHASEFSDIFRFREAMDKYNEKKAERDFHALIADCG